mgnify:CR=1 FL=1
MKRKILYTAAIVIIATASFIIGRNTVNQSGKLNLDNNADFEMACDFMGQIVDWNTDGKELAIMTKDGYELYAYKSENVYQMER